MDQTEARTIPATVAICPVCGKGLWIKGINEVVRSRGCDRVIPVDITIACETEPRPHSRKWFEWHFSAQQVGSWIEVQARVGGWLRRSDQKSRVDAIWNTGGGDRHAT